jgi:hypothetical protein
MQSICVATSRNRTGNCKKIRSGGRSNYRRYGWHRQQEKQQVDGAAGSRQGASSLECKQIDANKQRHKQMNELRECKTKAMELATEDERRKSGGIINENETAK